MTTGRVFGKNAARDLVYQAVKKGLLVRQPCEVCGTEKVEAHHDDYAQPLEVRWLCLVHHREAGVGVNGVKDLLTFRCTSEEKESWKRAAARGGFRTVSAWMRAMLDAECERVTARRLAEGTAVVSAAAVVPVSPLSVPLVKPGTPRRSMCEHRRAPDQFCARCDS